MPQEFWAPRPRIYLNGDTSATRSASRGREELARRKTVQAVLPPPLGQGHGGDATGQHSSPLKQQKDGQEAGTPTFLSIRSFIEGPKENGRTSYSSHAVTV